MHFVVSGFLFDNHEAAEYFVAIICFTTRAKRSEQTITPVDLV